MKKTITPFLILLFFSTYGRLAAQVSADGNGVAIAVASSLVDVTTMTIPSFNVGAGPNKLLVVIARGSQSQTVTTMTFNGQSMTRLGAAVSNGGARIELWYLALGTVGSPINGNIVANWFDPFQYGGLAAASFQGVDQTTPVNNLVSAISTSSSTTSLPITISGNSGDMAVAGIAAFGVFPTPPTFTAGSGQTQQATVTATSTTQAHRLSTSIESNSGGAVGMDWSISGLGSATPAPALMHIGANIQKAAALPVELVNFSATLRSGATLLEWNTASEFNNRGFDIERSKDGFAFKKTGFVAGNGTTTEANDYSFLDETAVHSLLHGDRGVFYYRLRQTDFDGKEAFSKVVAVDLTPFLKLPNLVRVYPNPVTDGKLTLVLPEKPGEPKHLVRLYDATGRLVFSQKIAANGQPVSLDLAGLVGGVYGLEASGVFQKVVVVR